MQTFQMGRAYRHEVVKNSFVFFFFSFFIRDWRQRAKWLLLNYLLQHCPPCLSFVRGELSAGLFWGNMPVAHFLTAPTLSLLGGFGDEWVGEISCRLLSVGRGHWRGRLICNLRDCALAGGKSIDQWPMEQKQHVRTKDHLQVCVV